MIKEFDIFKVSLIFKDIFDTINKSIDSKDYHFKFTNIEHNMIGIEFFDFLEYKHFDFKFNITIDAIYLISKIDLNINSLDFKERFTNALLISYIIVYFENRNNFNIINIKLDDNLDDVCFKLYNLDKNLFISLITNNKSKLPMEFFNKYHYLIQANNFDLI